MAAEKPQPPEEEQNDRYVVDDALWLVPSGNYIDTGPPLEDSLFDDPTRLDRAWRLTMRTLRSEAQESAEKKRQVEEQARTFIDEAERVASAEGHSDEPTEGSERQARGEVVALGPVGWFERLVGRPRSAVRRTV